MSEELKVRRLLLKCFHNGFNAKHTAELITEKYGVKGYASRTCQRWHRKFREGDFNLLEKPTHNNKPRNRPERNPLEVGHRSRGRVMQKQVKVERVTFQQENRQQDTRTRTSAGNDFVQKLMQRNRGITVSKVQTNTTSARETTKVMPKRISHSTSKDSTGSRGREGTIRVKEPSALMSKRSSLPLNKQPTVTATKPISFSQRRSACAVLQQRRPDSSNNLTSRSQSRPTRSLNTDLRLPPSIAKRMETTQLSTESHTIGEGSKGAQKTGETVKKAITVQFQNISPEVAKNTVRKSTESRHSSTNGSKKTSTQSSNPLASPKGVIYLNPQEIFGEKLNKKKTPTSMLIVAKPASGNLTNKVTNTPAPVVPQAPPPIVTVEDSDSEDDLLFPADVCLPPPKVKAVVNTFTTYWDMETDKPILLNPSDEMIPTLPPVIEIE